jgi:hypothetical protein
MQISVGEWACLEYFVRHPDGEGLECSSAMLEELVSRGLLERQAALPLPGMAWRYHYRLTDAGRRVLA